MDSTCSQLTEVTAFAPATIANLGTGFDLIGLAIEGPGDTVCVRRVDTPGVLISKIEGDKQALPLHPEKNTAGVAALAFLKEYPIEKGVQLEIKKNMPLCSGLGSSSASAVATVKALNTLMGNPFSNEKLLEFAREGERIASGAAHLDNVAPSLLGGITYIENEYPIRIQSLPFPDDLYFAVITPSIEIHTGEARKILPKEVPLNKVIEHSRNVANMLLGFLQKDLEKLKSTFVDCYIQTHRTRLIPFYDEVIKQALCEGALGAGISGSGPSLFAACISEKKAKDIVLKMAHTFQENQQEVRYFTSPVNSQGAMIIKST
jgi:homoserine kinase